jgi:hypothetical protein
MKAPRRFLIAAIAAVALVIGIPAQAHAHGGWSGGHCYSGGGHYYSTGYFHGSYGGYCPYVYYPSYSYSYIPSYYSSYPYVYYPSAYSYGYPYYYRPGVTIAFGGHRYPYWRGYRYGYHWRYHNYHYHH